MSPFAILCIGIATVLGMILIFKMNAFISLITAAMIVSLLAPLTPEEQSAGIDQMKRVASAFGASAGNIGIVIALAAVIGQCMMDSGAADRVVRSFLKLLGEKRAPVALMGSGYVLAVPVFFDTVFYLLVPLARSLHKRTGRNYLLYLLSIAAGGAITHTLVPPTPGPLLMAENLKIDLGVMIIVGACVAVPAALCGIIFATFADRFMNVPMRQIGAVPDPEPMDDHQLPALLPSLLPVILPVLLISADTIASTMAKQEAKRTAESAQVAAADETPQTSALPADRETSDDAARGGDDAKASASAATEAPAAVSTIDWKEIQQTTAIIGNPSFALLVSTAIALILLWVQRRPTLSDMSRIVETSLMSGGAIILITAAGGAFGAMLKTAQVGPAIEALFAGKALTGVPMLFLGFAIASVLKFAQGSSTVAMITASAMIATMGATSESLGFNIVYLATAIGAGSLVGSWMNDSGFWVFAKMGGLTEIESLKSWTPLLIVLGLVSMATTVMMALFVPLTKFGV